MTPADFEKLKADFCCYADGFIENSTTPGPLKLKKEHTMRVCREIHALGKAVGIPLEDIRIAETMALFHDIGRFVQYEKYGTFVDRHSEDHAALSLMVLDKNGLINVFPEDEKNLIREAIACHNAAEIPSCLNKRAAFFARMLRDADKLDIWRVVIDNYTSPDFENRDAVNLGLPDDGKFSTEAFAAIFDHTFVKSNTIRRLNDFKLMQISWVFDLNFARTAALVKERSYILRIAATMPETPELADALEEVYRFLDRRG